MYAAKTIATLSDSGLRRTSATAIPMDPLTITTKCQVTSIMGQLTQVSCTWTSNRPNKTKQIVVMTSLPDNGNPRHMWQAAVEAVENHHSPWSGVASLERSTSAAWVPLAQELNDYSTM